jgi:hypothetical protein
MTSDTYALLLGLALFGYTALVATGHRRVSAITVLHNVAWVIALVVVGTGLLNYQPISVTAWLIVTGAIIAFNLGSVIGVTSLRGAGAGTSPPGTLRLVPLWAYVLLLVLFSIGFAVYLATISRLYGLGTLVNDPIAIRGNTDVLYLEEFPLYGKLLFYLGPVCFVLTVFPRFVDRLPRTPLALRVLLVAYLAVAQVALLQRTNLFTSALWALGLYLVAGTRDDVAPLVTIRARHLVVTAALCLVSFQVIAVALEKTSSAESGFRYSADAPLRDSALAMPLHYAASGLPAFGVLVESRNTRWPTVDDPWWGDNNPQTWGVATFAAPAKVVPGLRRWEDLPPFVRVPVSTNVYTWLEPWYRDFRAPGAILGALVAGVITGWAVRTRGGTTTGLLLCGFLVGMTALASFTNRFSSVLSIVSLLAVAALSVLVRFAGRPVSEVSRAGDHGSGS